jgi:5-methylcytosine-specific restriction protein B
MATVNEIKHIIARTSIYPGQISLYKALYDSGDIALSANELIQKLGRRDWKDLHGVLRSLGNRIRYTKSVPDNNLDLNLLFEITGEGNQKYYKLKPETHQALEELPELISLMSLPLDEIHNNTKVPLKIKSGSSLDKTDINEKIEKVQNLSTKFELFERDNESLFNEINSLVPEELEAIYNEYRPVLDDFKPVNLLRFEVINLLKSGEKINLEKINFLKDKIRERDIEYFNKYGEKLIESLINYPEKKKDLFVIWTSFRLFYSFFFNSQIKKLINSFLKDIATEIISTLELKNFKYHTVSFDGPSNFGNTFCWIALYPDNRPSHRQTYQLFIAFYGSKIKAGLSFGDEVPDSNSEDLIEFESLDDALEKLDSLKSLVLEKNKTLKSFWKYAPGENGKYWKELYEQDIMAIGWDTIGDYKSYSDNEEIAQALNITNITQSNEILNINWFKDKAIIGDIVIANQGRKKCLGIGIIIGEYEFRNNRPYFKNVRKVNWIIDKPVELNKGLFRADTFSPTKEWNEIKSAYLQTYPELKDTFLEIENYSFPEVESRSQVNYWWMNANPKIWSISSFKKGDIQSYTTYNDRGNKRVIYKYFQEVQPGDLVIGYESSPVKKIKAIFEIIQGIHKDTNQNEIIKFKIKEIFQVPVELEYLKNLQELEKCEPLIQNQGSLFKLKPEEFVIIRDLIDEKNISEIIESKNDSSEVYSKVNALEKLFIEETELQKYLDLLEYKKNIIFQGPPGVGKTFIAKILAYTALEKKDDSKIKTIQFHQSYSYEDFIQGIRPKTEGEGFRIKNGIFYDFCKKAEKDPKNKYFFIIDEINRGNLSKIFGELLMLIEADKRGIENEISLTYSDEPFSVPHNLYIIGTMNTADRSLAIVDYALRRRFGFIPLEPNFNPKFQKHLSGFIDEPLIRRIVDNINNLNKMINKDHNLGNGFQIGHSYFCNLSENINSENWFQVIINMEIAPLLREYWFDDLEKAENQINILLSSI